MGYDKIFDVADKLLGRFLPKKEEALRNQIKKLERERDEILKKPQDVRITRRLTTVLRKLRNAEDKLKSSAQ